MNGLEAGGPRLAVDAHRLNGSRAGVHRYLVALLREWASMELPFGEVTLYAPEEIPQDCLPAPPHPFTLRALPQRGPRGAWLHWTLARAARSADVLFCPSYAIPIYHPCPVVVTIHDVLHELLPHSFPWRNGFYRSWLYRYSARNADQVVTDSLTSKRGIERVYDLPGERIKAIPLGVDHGLCSGGAREAQEARSRHGLPEAPISLFVGKFSRRRNLSTLIRAFARLPTDARGTLVLVGENHLGLPLAELGEELGLGDSLRIAGHVSDDDLTGLYAAADVFVYPSDYEGFGLPVLEAMAAGVPVVAVDTPAIREVVEDCATLLPSATIEGLASVLTRLIGDPLLRREYAERGKARAQRFSWSETAVETMNVLAATGARHHV